MTDPPADEAPDRIVIRLDAGGPIEVGDLTGSFAALARLYERHYRHDGDPAPKLYITRLETGSIIAEITPLIVLLGAVVTAMDHAMVVPDFTRRLINGIKAFSSPSEASEVPGPPPSKEDASDLREFVRPLAGKSGATLGIKHARFVRDDGERRTIAEYIFDEAEINRATINMENVIAEPDVPAIIDLARAPEGIETSAILQEVPLLFEQATRRPGRERGRTGDRGIISEVSPKALPVYFRRSVQNLKEQMVRGETNPLTDMAYIVDVYVIRVDGEPKGYMVTAVHATIPLDE